MCAMKVQGKEVFILPGEEMSFKLSLEVRAGVE